MNDSLTNYLICQAPTQKTAWLQTSQQKPYVVNIPSCLACSAGVFWVGESLLIGSLRWSRHLWFYDRGRLGRVVILTLTVAPFPPLFGSFNMALSRLKPFARARWKRLHCRLRVVLQRVPGDNDLKLSITASQNAVKSKAKEQTKHKPTYM